MFYSKLCCLPFHTIFDHFHQVHSGHNFPWCQMSPAACLEVLWLHILTGSALMYVWVRITKRSGAQLVQPSGAGLALVCPWQTMPSTIGHYLLRGTAEPAVGELALCFGTGACGTEMGGQCCHFLPDPSSRTVSGCLLEMLKLNTHAGLWGGPGMDELRMRRHLSRQDRPQVRPNWSLSGWFSFISF